MRLIGHLKTEASARAFGGYLTGLDVRNLVEPDNEGWAVWVYSEDQITTGHKEFDAYIQNPADAKFRQATQRAAQMEEQQRQEAKAYAKRVKTSDQIWTRSDRATATLVVVVLCVIAFIATQMNQDGRVADALMLDWPAVLGGQFWRIITPIFLHFNFLHIFFNMWVFYAFGSMIETRQGPWRLVILVLAIGAVSNLAQYYFNPSVYGFGGMSGVDYGLLGYIWLRGKVDPNSGLYIDLQNLVIMLVWFFLCIFGVIGHVANGTHIAGLLLGMAWGALPLVRSRS